MKTQSRDRWRSFRAGFTLVELLVVIAIIAVLAVFSLSAVSRMKLSAAKTQEISKMRDIGAATAVWSADNLTSEPFYFANGTSSWPDEVGNNPNKWAAANPGSALYNTSNPSSGYLQSPAAFFSPLTAAKAPSQKDYDPTKKAPWGTFAWRYPWIMSENRTSKQKQYIMTDSGQEPETWKLPPSLEGRIVMHTSYTTTVTPKFGKEIYHVLMTDNSVQYAADNKAAFDRYRGKPD